MDSLERRQLHLQEEIARNTERIADAIEDLMKIYKFTQSSYIRITKEETENDR